MVQAQGSDIPKCSICGGLGYFVNEVEECCLKLTPSNGCCQKPFRFKRKVICHCKEKRNEIL